MAYSLHHRREWRYHAMRNKTTVEAANADVNRIIVVGVSLTKVGAYPINS